MLLFLNKHVHYHDGETLFLHDVSIARCREDAENRIFSIFQPIFAHSTVETNKQAKNNRKPRLNAPKHEKFYIFWRCFLNEASGREQAAVVTVAKGVLQT